jgi:streptogramin lyase
MLFARSVLIISLIALSIGLFPAARADELPNELRLELRGLKHFLARRGSFLGHEVEIRLDPRYGRPAVIAGLHAEIPLDRIAAEVARKELSADYSFARAKVSRGVTELALLFRGESVRDAWLRAYRSAPGRQVIALKLPRRSLEPVRFKRKPLVGKVGLILVEGAVAEYSLEGSGRVRRLRFPEDSGIRDRVVKALKPVKAPGSQVKAVPIPRGSFPDQMKVDRKGRVWFTQPMDNLLTGFDPATGAWLHKSVGAAPDGLGLDRQGRLWFGEYNNKALGFYSPDDDRYESIPLPYPESRPAIPFEDQQGTLWLTDHERNTVSAFDVRTKTFKPIPVPSAGAWPVDLTQTSDPRHVYVTECQANKIGRIEVSTGKYDELSLGTSACPAFFAAEGPYLFISLWSTGGFIRLDTRGGELVEYVIQTDARDGEAESGLGPVARTADGMIVLGSLRSRRAYLFDPRSEQLTYAEGIGEQKDGIAVAPDGTIWLSGRSGAREIYGVRFR